MVSVLPSSWRVHYLLVDADGDVQRIIQSSGPLYSFGTTLWGPDILFNIIYIMRTLWDEHPQQVLIASFKSIPIQHQSMRLTKV